MTFEEWMRHRKLSESSILKYEGAISGAMTEWAIAGGLIEGPLTSIRSHSRFEAIASKIRKLPIYIERNKRGHSMYNSALVKYSEFLAEGFDSDIEDDIDNIITNKHITNTEKSSLLKARIGQGIFRQKLIAYWKGCAVTRYKDSSLLVASHIKPWRAATDYERLDPFNGLLLLPTLDRAFDAGLITFEETGAIKISPLLLDAKTLGINAAMKIIPDSKHLPYLSFHREKVFRAT